MKMPLPILTEQGGSAKWDKKTKKLRVKMMVNRKVL